MVISKKACGMMAEVPAGKTLKARRSFNRYFLEKILFFFPEEIFLRIQEKFRRESFGLSWENFPFFPFLSKGFPGGTQSCGSCRVRDVMNSTRAFSAVCVPSGLFARRASRCRTAKRKKVRPLGPTSSLTTCNLTKSYSLAPASNIIC